MRAEFGDRRRVEPLRRFPWIGARVITVFVFHRNEWRWSPGEQDCREHTPQREES